MSRKAIIITCVVGVGCVFLGMFVLTTLPTFSWLGSAISFIGIVLLACMISAYIQDVIDEEIEQVKLYRAKVDALCEIAKQTSIFEKEKK